MHIWLEDEVEKDLGFDLEEVAKNVLSKVLESEGLEDDMEVSILLTDDDGIRELNKEHRGKDAKTDVLSFPMMEFETPGQLPNEIIEEVVSLGDVVISVPTLIDQAREYGHDNLREYAFLLTHSFLHLLGYDHIEKEDADIMEPKQEQILEQLNITR